MDVLATAASGMISAQAQFDRAAGAVASGGDPVPAVVQSVEAKTSFGANVAVLKTADKMMGALLDIIA
jgi:flagellar basal body rod protein FlgC